ncbi:MAG: S-layer homology domain-containing protein [Desulfocucumaceae bacterium]
MGLRICWIRSDISGHWAEKQIGEWVSKGLIKGYSDGTFNPDQGITRAEFMTLANKDFGFTGVSSAGFTDVRPSDWFAGEIARAKAAGYISGYQDGTIRPDNNVTRQEVAAMITKIVKASAGDNLKRVNSRTLQKFPNGAGALLEQWQN